MEPKSESAAAKIRILAGTAKSFRKKIHGKAHFSTASAYFEVSGLQFESISTFEPHRSSTIEIFKC
jgi:hypothetical protein